MKKFSVLVFSAFSFLFIINFQTEARDLTYRLGAGFRQTYVNVLVNNAGAVQEDVQMNGIEASYGIARDLQASVFFATAQSFNRSVLGPRLRYDFQRLLSRDDSTWQYLNLFVEFAFLAKFGSEIKEGISLHIPTLGFEIMPFQNGLAFLASGGLIFDFVEKTRIGITQGNVGVDLGLKYYF